MSSDRGAYEYGTSQGLPGDHAAALPEAEQRPNWSPPMRPSSQTGRGKRERSTGA
jgi:hypothetical protein